jgi:hypothetical protein
MCPSSLRAHTQVSPAAARNLEAPPKFVVILNAVKDLKPRRYLFPLWFQTSRLQTRQ